MAPQATIAVKSPNRIERFVFITVFLA